MEKLHKGKATKSLEVSTERINSLSDETKDYERRMNAIKKRKERLHKMEFSKKNIEKREREIKEILRQIEAL